MILALESSCDETAAAVLSPPSKLLSNIVSSQAKEHEPYGGVVPELAARSHIEKIDIIAQKALEVSNIKLEDVDAIAATAGPGLIVCLSVGLNFAKAISASIQKPFIAVNHLKVML